MRFSSTSLNLFILSHYSSNTNSFIPTTKVSRTFVPQHDISTTSLLAKKKKAKLGSLEALDLLEEDDSMLSAKELAAKKKKELKAQKKQAKQAEDNAPKKDLKAAALKALEQMEADDAAANADDQPILSKKEMKAAAKAAAKKEEKLAKKKAKKAGKAADDDDDDIDLVNGAPVVQEVSFLIFVTFVLMQCIDNRRSSTRTASANSSTKI